MGLKPSAKPFLLGGAVGVVFGGVGMFGLPLLRYDPFARNPFPPVAQRPFTSESWIGSLKTAYNDRVATRNSMRQSVLTAVAKGISVPDVLKLLGAPDEVSMNVRGKALPDGEFDFRYTIGMVDDRLGPLHDFSLPDMLFIRFSADGKVVWVGEGAE